MAEEVARDAMRRGAGMDEACEKAWSYLSCWLRHPANGASATSTTPASASHRSTG